MGDLFRNGRFRAALAGLVAALVAHFGFDVPVGTLESVLAFLAGLLGGAAIPSEAFGAKS